MSVGLFNLGGNATSAMIGRFGLGGFDIQIDVQPYVPSKPSGGSTGNLKPIRLNEERKYKLVTITVRRNGETWVTTYKVLETVSNILVKVVNIINKIINTIEVKASNARSSFKSFRIKK